MNASASQQREIRYGRRRRAARVLFVLLVLATVAVCAAILMMFKRPPQGAAAEATVPQADVEQVRPEDARVVVRGHGIVRPAVQMEITPEVSGRIVFLHSRLRAGGIIGAGERILQIDPSSYELAVRRAQAAVEEAQARLAVEQAQADVHRRELRQVQREAEPDALLLALPESRIRQARAAVESAKAELSLAELQLGRTSVFLPFDVVVGSEMAGLGQYAGAGQPLAVAYGTEAFEIEVPIGSEELASLDGFADMCLPGRDLAGTARMAAEVKAIFGGNEHVWQGFVVGATGRVDQPLGKIGILVEVPRPLDVSGDRPPLLVGTPVEVSIAGERRKALEEGNADDHRRPQTDTDSGVRESP